jgi:hypothetical protein
VVFFAPFRELSTMINKTCHATRAYLVVGGETNVAATDELCDAAQRAAKAAAESTSAPIRSVLYREASNENVNDAPGKRTSGTCCNAIDGSAAVMFEVRIART